MNHLATGPEQLHLFREQVAPAWVDMPVKVKEIYNEIVGDTNNELQQDALHERDDIRLSLITAWAVVQKIYEKDLADTIGITNASWLDVIDSDRRSVVPSRLRDKILTNAGIDISFIPDFERHATIIFAGISELYDAAYPDGKLPRYIKLPNS